ncbi:hypothetical protein B0H12DRAFT_1121580 [Mycena haematopus]|nr:hypothetical protein B0H12DRAFT_1121580 [Mycena haematopus]
MSVPLAAISSLPNELLEAIAAAGQTERVQGVLELFKSEWTLSHVSRRFRHVIIGSPSLWTLIEMDFGVEGSVEILKLYLERSQPQSISAILRRRSAPKATADLLVERLGHVVQHINRIWRLSIEVRADSMEVLIPFRDIAAPALRHLELVKKDGGSWASVQVFSAASALTFLKMDGLKPGSPVPPWTASLTHLEFWGGQDHIDEDATTCEGSRYHRVYILSLHFVSVYRTVLIRRSNQIATSSVLTPN